MSTHIISNNVINLESDEYRGIDINSYIEKKIKKAKNEPYSSTIKRINKRMELIGDYEYANIFNGVELVDFYKNCKSELNNIKDKGYDKLSMDTFLAL